MRCAIVYVILLGIAVIAEATEPEFRQSFCTTQPSGGLYLRLGATDGRVRTLSFSQGVTGSVAFKGTTLSDLKWAAPYSSFKEFVLASEQSNGSSGVLFLVAHKGAIKEVGLVEHSCWQRLEAVVRGTVSLRATNGS